MIVFQLMIICTCVYMFDLNKTNGISRFQKKVRGLRIMIVIGILTFYLLYPHCQLKYNISLFASNINRYIVFVISDKLAVIANNELLAR